MKMAGIIKIKLHNTLLSVMFWNASGCRHCQRGRRIQIKEGKASLHRPIVWFVWFNVGLFV